MTYYLNRYGESGSSWLDSNSKVQGNTFLGAYLNYNKVDLNFGFLTDDDVSSDTDPTFSTFYNTYKTMLGSDLLSYANKYTNTSDMAMGDLVNIISNSTEGSTNLSAVTKDFLFNVTKDGNPYRYTNGSTDFGSISSAYDNYASYRLDLLAGKSVNSSNISTAVNLSSLGINYSAMSASKSTDEIKSTYKNLVDQIVKEMEAIKPSTISVDDKNAMVRTLQEKRAALEVVDTSLYGRATTRTEDTSNGNKAVGMRVKISAKDGKTAGTAFWNLIHEGGVEISDDDGARRLAAYMHHMGMKAYGSLSDMNSGTEESLDYSAAIYRGAYQYFRDMIAASDNDGDPNTNLKAGDNVDYITEVDSNGNPCPGSGILQIAIKSNYTVGSASISGTSQAPTCFYLNTNGVIDDGSIMYNYQKQSNTDAELSKDILKPLDWHVTSGNEYWDSGYCSGTDDGVLEALAKWTDINGYTGDGLNLRYVNYWDTDTSSLVEQLGTDLKEYVHASSTNAQIKGALYFADVATALMEQYWIENLNKKSPEVFTEYLLKEFRAYINPQATDTGTKEKVTENGTETEKYMTTFRFHPYNESDEFLLKIDLNEDPSKTNFVDHIMESQTFAQIYAKMETRARAEMELFEASTALDVIQNVNTQEYIYRLDMLGALEKDLRSQNSGLSSKDIDAIFAKVTKNLVTLGPGASRNPWWQEYFPWFKGFYGNLPDGATPEEMFDADGKLKLRMVTDAGKVIDPYVVKINDVDYVMGVDSNKDGKINGAQEVLGINDTIETSFKSLKELDLDGNGIISQAEMKEKGIIFEAMNAVDRLNGNKIDTDLVHEIDLSSIQSADGTDGVFGNFKVKLSNGKTSDAVQTFESQEYFNNLFGTYVDMSFLSTNQTAENTDKSAEKKEEKAPVVTEAPVKEVKEEKIVTPKTESKKINLKDIQSKSYKFFSYLDDENKDKEQKEEVKDTKKTIFDSFKTSLSMTMDDDLSAEELLDDVCWKKNIDRLTVKQRYDILGSINDTQDKEAIIKKIEEKLAQTKSSTKQFSA